MLVAWDHEGQAAVRVATGEEDGVDVDYQDTFIAVAPDCPVSQGTAPPRHPSRVSVAAEQYRLVSENPYRYTSADVLFEVHADREGIPDEERPAARAAFFATPRACLRASPLGKKYGWGIHCDEQGRVAVFGVESADYRALAEGGRGVRVLPALRSSRAAPSSAPQGT